MTRKDKPSLAKVQPAKRRVARDARCGRWVLQDAKARFSELVRRAKSEGPQHVTVHGREEVVVISAKEFRRLKGAHSGQQLVDLMGSSPLRDITMEQPSFRPPVRDIDL